MNWNISSLKQQVEFMRDWKCVCAECKLCIVCMELVDEWNFRNGE